MDAIAKELQRLARANGGLLQPEAVGDAARPAASAERALELSARKRGEAAFDTIWDRRAFTAIAPALRPAYEAQLARLARPGARLLLVFLLPRSVPAAAAAENCSDNGAGAVTTPPFAISAGCLDALFVRRWAREPLLPARPDVFSRHGPERTALFLRRAGD